ncbi:MAG: low molecular weight phosphatase family protein [Nanobdellota archaeon]
MNILFVCKYNRFRSRIAEAYFNKINSNKNFKATSRGIIKGDYPLNRTEVSTAKKFGLDISGRPKGLEIELLKKTDLIVIVADNVPKEVFYTTFKGRIILWRIKDLEHGDGKDLIERKIIRIEGKVRKLLKKLDKESFRKKLELNKEKAKEDHINRGNRK